MKRILILTLTIASLYGASNNVLIEPLARHPKKVGQLFELLFNNMLKKSDPDHDAVQKRYMPFLEEHLQETELPIGYIALVDQQPIGLCCLRQKPVSTDEKCSWFKDHPEIYPWIAGLFVVPEHRKKGIAKALVAHTIKRAKELNFEEIYLFTEKDTDVYNIYIEHGCKEIDSATFADENTTMQLSIMIIPTTNTTS